METHEYFQHGFSGHGDSLARRPLSHYSESRDLTVEQIRQKERENQKKHSRIPYSKRVDKEYYYAMRQAEKEESLAALRAHNAELIRISDEKKAKKIADDLASFHESYSRAEIKKKKAADQRRENPGESVNSLYQTLFENHDGTKGKKRYRERKQNNIEDYLQEHKRQRSRSRSSGGSISKSSRYTKKSKTAKKRKNKRKTMRR
jgi:hypothetical protein